MTADSAIRPARHKVGRAGLFLSAALVLTLALSACKSSEEQAAEYFQSAIQLVAQGDVDRAMVQLRNVFNEDGSHYEARKMLAELNLQQNNPSAAYSQYLRLAEQYPDDLDTRVALARLASNGQQREEFERHANRAAELAPDNPDVQAIMLAQRYLTLGQDGDAATRDAIFTEAAALSQTRPDDVLLLDILLDQSARNRDLDRSEDLIDRLIALQPDNPLRYRQRLALLSERGDMAGMEAHLRATIDQFPEDTAPKADLISFYVSQDRSADAEAYLRGLVDTAPEGDSAARIDLIRFVEMTRGPDAARQEMQAALDAGGDPLIFRTLLAGSDYAAGRRDEAIAAVQTMLEEPGESSPELRNVQVQLAMMLAGAGREDEARPLVAQVLAEEPSHPGALKMQANWDIQSDRADDAILALRSVLDQDNRDVGALSLMADAYYRAGEPDLVRDFLAQAAEASGNAPAETLRFARSLLAEGRARAAEDALLPALRNDPENIALLTFLGQVYLEMPDLPRAQGVVDRLNQFDTPEARNAANTIQLAQRSREGGQQAAITYLEDLAAQGDGSIEAQLGLLRARLSADDLEGAQAQLDQLVAQEPENVLVRQAQAVLASAQGQNDEARQILDRLIADVPAELAPHLMRLRLTIQTEGDEAGLAVLEASLRDLPDDPDLLWAQAGLLERAGDIDGAIGIYEQLYAQDSGSVIMANNLASLIATHHPDDAERIARATVVARRLSGTTEPAFMDTYGWLQHLNGNSRDALPYLEGAARGLSDDPTVQLHLGIVQAAVGQNERAEAQLTHGLEMAGDQTSSTVTTARAILEALLNPEAQDRASGGDAASSGAIETN